MRDQSDCTTLMHSEAQKYGVTAHLINRGQAMDEEICPEVNVIQFLLDNWSDTNLTDNRGRTALMCTTRDH